MNSLRQLGPPRCFEWRFSLVLPGHARERLAVDSHVGMMVAKVLDELSIRRVRRDGGKGVQGLVEKLAGSGGAEAWRDLKKSLAVAVDRENAPEGIWRSARDRLKRVRLVIVIVVQVQQIVPIDVSKRGGSAAVAEVVVPGLAEVDFTLRMSNLLDERALFGRDLRFRNVNHDEVLPIPVGLILNAQAGANQAPTEDCRGDDRESSACRHQIHPLHQ